MTTWKNMGRAVIFLLLGAASAASHAADPSAGSVIARCAVATGAPRATCVGMVEGFLAGYSTGIQKGVRATFAQDPLVLQTTNGNEDTYLRYRRVVEHTGCLPADAAGATALRLFEDYVKAHPETEQEPFGDVMEVVLDTAFPCLDQAAESALRGTPAATR